MVIASLRLDLPAAAHGGILFSNAEQLEPEALDLEGAGQQLRAQLRGGSLAPQHRLYLGLSLPHQPEQEAREQLDDFVGVGRGAGGSWISGLGKRDRGERLEQGLGHTTGSRSGAPVKKRRRFSTARWPMAIRVSWVALPRCGKSTTFSILRSSGVTAGSRS